MLVKKQRNLRFSLSSWYNWSRVLKRKKFPPHFEQKCLSEIDQQIKSMLASITIIEESRLFDEIIFITSYKVCYFWISFSKGNSMKLHSLQSMETTKVNGMKKIKNWTFCWTGRTLLTDKVHRSFFIPLHFCLKQRKKAVQNFSSLFQVACHFKSHSYVNTQHKRMIGIWL